MGLGAIYLPILRITAALLMLCVLPPGDLVDEVRQLVPELVGQRTLVHVNRDSIGLGAAILHGGRIGHGVGEVHRLAAAGGQGLDAVGGDSGSQLRLCYFSQKANYRPHVALVLHRGVDIQAQRVV